MANDDPLPPGDDSNTPRRSSSVVCEFCECKLSGAGEVLKLGGKAKAFRDSEGAIDKATERIAALETTIAELKTELETARATKPADVAPAGRRGFLSGD
jgi:hypothetical protein